MKFFVVILILTSVNAFASELYSVGVRDYSFLDQSRNRKIRTHVWYPADAKATVRPIDAKGPLVPVTGALNATVATTSKPFPVVLLSHGSMGLANRLFWIAEPLVKNGFIVIGVDHPGNMFGESSADGVMRIWDRAKDLTFSLDEVLKVPEVGSKIDRAKVSAIGHSAGGATVLLLAGAKFSFDRFQIPTPECDGSKDPFYERQCAEFKKIDVKGYGKNVIEADYSDKRVKAVVALDPGFARSFHPDSLKNLKTRALLFIAEKLAVPQDQIFSKDFLKLMKTNHIKVIPNSVHMTFLAPCKRDIPLDDPELKELCADQKSKIEIQQIVATKILSFLRQ